MWSDGVLFAFDKVELLNVIGQQIDFNYATFTNYILQQQVYIYI